MTSKDKQKALKLEKQGKAFEKKAHIQKRNLEKLEKQVNELNKHIIKNFNSASSTFNKARKLYK